ncbi:MAG TPA: NAD(P)-dependent oxidoreductase [Steroidobacteraceae bacterium]|nr:NAD(P)-dependent oxidoreductase [Steroidobacteraceae bacterium]
MRVGFIGIGNMGWPMACNLVKHGHEVLVWDTDEARRVAFAREHGAIPAREVAELATGAAIVSMLPTGKIVRDVYLAPPHALLPHLRPGTLVIDMSSSEPEGTRALGKELAARKVAFIDAPVSGAVPRAQSGTLTIMIGGDDPEAIERAKPVLSCMGNRLMETGSLGTGHAMKALNNYVSAAAFCASVEALQVGKRFGLDPRRMIEILNVSTGRNFNTEMTLQEHVVDGRFATGFALGLMAKDVRAAADLAAAMKLEAPVAELMRARWDFACERMGAGGDFTTAVKAWFDEG